MPKKGKKVTEQRVKGNVKVSIGLVCVMVFHYVHRLLVAEECQSYTTITADLLGFLLYQWPHPSLKVKWYLCNYIS